MAVTTPNITAQARYRYKLEQGHSQGPLPLPGDASPNSLLAARPGHSGATEGGQNYGADNLQLSGSAMRKVLGVSEASISRLKSSDKAKNKIIDLDKKEAEMARYLLRIYRSLDSLFGGNLENCRRWFHSNNRHLNGIPSELVQTIEGIVDVARYVDAMRGKV